jgi:peptide/nickel transport system permease protein
LSTTQAAPRLVVATPILAPPPRDTSGYWRSAWLRLRRDRAAMVGGLIVLALAAIALLAPVVAPFDPNQRLRDGLGDLGQPLPAGGKYLLGTDGLGRDLLSRLIWGGQLSLLIGITANSLAVAIGLVLGATAGYIQGAVGQVIMRTVDVLMAFPPLLLAIALAALLRPSVGVVITVIAFTYWIYLARIVYGQTLSLREKEFVEAARAIGAGHFEIIFRHLMPHLASVAIVYATLGIASTVLTEASLSYLGIGVRPPTASWGGIIREAQQYYRAAPWLIAFPGVALTLAVMGFNLLGDGLRDALDPFQKGR